MIMCVFHFGRLTCRRITSHCIASHRISSDLLGSQARRAPGQLPLSPVPDPVGCLDHNGPSRALQSRRDTFKVYQENRATFRVEINLKQVVAFHLSRRPLARLVSRPPCNLNAHSQSKSYLFIASPRKQRSCRSRCRLHARGAHYVSAHVEAGGCGDADALCARCTALQPRVHIQIRAERPALKSSSRADRYPPNCPPARLA